MNLWAFRFTLWYLCIMLVQPQNRFTFLWPLRIANLAFMISAGLAIFSSMEQGKPLIRLGPGTILALTLMFFAFVSQHMGLYQRPGNWSGPLDTIVKGALLLIMIEALATTPERVWAGLMSAVVGVLWWIKGGIQMSRGGVTWAGDRLGTLNVSLIDNPNGFAYYMCIMLPLYLYAYEQSDKKWLKIAFLACTLAAVWIILETGSRTGLVTLIAISVFLLPKYTRKHYKSLAFIALVVAMLYPMTSEANKARFRTIPQSFMIFIGRAEKPEGPRSQDEQSADERKAKNRDTWALIKAYPLFGVGIRPDESRYTDRFPMAAGHVHCEILFAGRQMGIIGMGIYVGLLATIFLCGHWVCRNATDWPAIRNLGWTLKLQAFAIMVGGYFCPLPWNPVTLMLAGFSSALMLNVKAEQRAKWDHLSGVA